MQRSDRAAVLTGCGAWLPPRLVTNSDFQTGLGTSDAWIRTRTGVACRHVVDPGMATADLAVQAGILALKSAGSTSVDALILATTSPDRLCPATAPEIAARLDLGHVAAFDIASASSGFVYGLAAAAGLIAAGTADRILFVAAEAFSTLVDPLDQQTAVLFGDGAGAIILRAGRNDEVGAVGPIDLGSDGGLADLLVVAAGGSRQRSMTGATIGEIPRADQYLRMNGAGIFRHAVIRMVESARRVLAHGGWSIDDVDRFVCHQANIRIQQAVTGRLKIDPARCLSNIEHVGNTQAASIPLLLAQAAADGTVVAGERVLLTAFGAGLSWGSALLTWPDIEVFNN